MRIAYYIVGECGVQCPECYAKAAGGNPNPVPSWDAQPGTSCDTCRTAYGTDGKWHEGKDGSWMSCAECGGQWPDPAKVYKECPFGCGTDIEPDDTEWQTSEALNGRR